jgi:hypothetical protein
LLDLSFFCTLVLFCLPFLLLPIPEQQGKEDGGFEVGGTVNACTKGIWLWHKPIPLKDGDITLIVIDTEGLGSTVRNQTADTRIFALALLLSSYFVYNSRGLIDGNAIEDLSLVINLSKHIQSNVKSSGSSDANTDKLHQFFPNFMWVVRDFTLQLHDSSGKTMSSKQYLENALLPQAGFSEDVQSKNTIKALLSNFFRQRDCATLVRPAEDEATLKSLQTIAYDKLRPEFRSTYDPAFLPLFLPSHVPSSLPSFVPLFFPSRCSFLPPLPSLLPIFLPPLTSFLPSVLSISSALSSTFLPSFLSSLTLLP